MRRLEIANGMDQLISLEIKDQDFRVFFRGGEQAVSRNIRGEVVEIAIFEFRQWNRLQRLQNGFLLSPCSGYKR